MLNFFVALFGAIGIGAKYSHEKSASAKRDDYNKKIISDMSSDLQAWEQKVIDEKREYEVSKLPVTDDLYVKIQNRIKNEAKIDIVADDMVRLGILAQDGKIPKQEAMFGFRSFGLWDYEEKERWKIQRKFMVWYDKELGLNGIKEPLLFVSGVYESKVKLNMNLAVPVSVATEVVGGKYFWEPMRLYV